MGSRGWLPYLGVAATFLTLIALLRWESGEFMFDRDEFFVDLPAHLPPPSIDLALEWGKEGKLLVHLNTRNFSFTKTCNWDGKPSFAEGHSHLFVDGRKVKSLYLPYGEIAGLMPGTHRITASLNVLPRHQTLVYGGKPLVVERDIVVPPDPPVSENTGT